MGWSNQLHLSCMLCGIYMTRRLSKKGQRLLALIPRLSEEEGVRWPVMGQAGGSVALISNELQVSLSPSYSTGKAEGSGDPRHIPFLKCSPPRGRSCGHITPLTGLAWDLAWKPSLTQAQRGRVWESTAQGFARPHSHSRSLSTSLSLSGLRSLSPRSLSARRPRLWSTPFPSSHLCVQFHDVSHLVPAKAHKPPVVLGAVPSHDHVRLEIGLPLDPVRRGGSPPLGEVRGRVAFCPDVVPGTREEKALSGREEGS